VWDINTLTKRHTLTHPEGVVKLCVSPLAPQHLYTASADGVVRLWDGRTGVCARTFTVWKKAHSLFCSAFSPVTSRFPQGHQDCCLDLAVSDDGMFAVSAADDSTAKLFAFTC
jgi:WD40 repeat protein